MPERQRHVSRVTGKPFVYTSQIDLPFRTRSHKIEAKYSQTPTSVLDYGEDDGPAYSN